MSIIPKLTSRISYPDPFKPSGVEFELPSPAEVTLTIFDQSGREVATLLQKVALDPGTHTIEFSDVEFTNNMYFYRLLVKMDGQEYVDTKTIVLDQFPPGMTSAQGKNES